MKILVTGAAGFIGSHLVEKLLNIHHDVVGLDNFDNYYDPKVKVRNLKAALDDSRFMMVKGDILDNDIMENLFSNHEINVVVHLAARAGVRASINDPVRCFRNNVDATTNLLEFCKKRNIKKFVFASSSSVYGNAQQVPFLEDQNVDHPISPYAASKKSAELVCYTFHHLYNIDIYALRFFTVYGPRQRPDMAIHKFTKLILENEPLPVFAEGNLKRDFTFIDDIVHGLLNSIESVRGFEVINLGDSKTISVSQLIMLIEQYLGKKAKKNMLPLQPGDVVETYADISKAKRFLNYEPSVQIQEGIRRFLDWYLANSGGQKPLT